MESFQSDHLELHGQEIARLAGIVEPAHLIENEAVQNFRNFKYGVRMSRYSFELLLCFLQDNKFMLLLRIMNQYVSIQGKNCR